MNSRKRTAACAFLLMAAYAETAFASGKNTGSNDAGFAFAVFVLVGILVYYVGGFIAQKVNEKPRIENTQCLQEDAKIVDFDTVNVKYPGKRITIRSRITFSDGSEWVTEESQKTHTFEGNREVRTATVTKEMKLRFLQDAMTDHAKACAKVKKKSAE